jgi:hypothetical protein
MALVVLSVVEQRLDAVRAVRSGALTAHVSETTITVELGDGDTHTVRRTTATTVATIKSRPPRTATKPSPAVAHQLAQKWSASPVTSHWRWLVEMSPSHDQSRSRPSPSTCGRQGEHRGAQDRRLR